jgi:uridine kinase
VLAWLGFHPQSFDRGFYLLVKAIQELRERKDGLVVTVGIGGPTGSGKTSLAEKVASVLGCVVIVSMEDYRTVAGADDGSDVDAIDFDALARNLQDLVKGKDTLMPLVDFQEKKRTGWRQLKISPSGVVIVDGAYALHSTLRSLLDIRVAVVKIIIALNIFHYRTVILSQ